MWIISKSHREFFFYTFLQSPHQVDMKNVVECFDLTTNRLQGNFCVDFFHTKGYIAHRYLPDFRAGKTFTVYILLPRGAKSALTTSIRLSLTCFPKTNESLREGQSRTTKAFVFTFTEKKWAMTSFLRIREKRESLLIYTLLWNGRHFLCDLIFC